MMLADSTLIMQGTTLPSGTQFVPMIYAASDATTSNLNTAKNYKTGIVLGFNEPNEANQADNTVAVSMVLFLDHRGQAGLLQGNVVWAIDANGCGRLDACRSHSISRRPRPAHKCAGSVLASNSSAEL